MNLPKTIALGFLLSQTIVHCQADSLSRSVDYYGVNLPVEERRSVGSDMVTIVMGGKAFLVSLPEASRQVALRYLSDNRLSNLIQTSDVQEIALAASRHNDASVLEAAVRLGLVRRDLNQFDSDALWLQILSEGQNEQIVRRLVEGLLEQALDSRVCSARVALGRLVSERQGQGQKIVGPDQLSDRAAQICSKWAMRQAVDGALAGQDLVKVQSDLRQRSSIFTLLSTSTVNPVDKIEVLLGALIEAFERVDVQLFGQSFAALREYAAALEVKENGVALQRSFIDRSVAINAHKAALEQLALMPFESRSPKIHTQLITALRHLPAADWSLFTDTQIRAALARYLTRDEEFRFQWIATQQRLIGELVSAGDLASAETMVNMVRGDDRSVADAVVPFAAGDLVAGYLNQGKIIDARRIYEQLSPRISPMTRVRLFMAQSGAILAYIIGLGLLAALVLRRHLGRLTEHRQQSPCAEGLAGDTPCTDDSGNSQEASLVSSEYAAALQVFGLKPGATIAEIKNAYRSAVKQYHPDLHRVGSKEDTTRFIELTAEYEKLLKLHERERSNRS
jgi:hypothetical protein